MKNQTDKLKISDRFKCLIKSEFEHRPEISVYNNNYYRHKEFGYIIYELCHEDENYYEYFLLQDGKNIFIGSSITGFNGKEDISLNFKEDYT